jgi:hypothetical protein
MRAALNIKGGTRSSTVTYVGEKLHRPMKYSREVIALCVGVSHRIEMLYVVVSVFVDGTACAKGQSSLRASGIHRIRRFI